VAFGESTYEGLITEENFYRMSESNFGDTGPHGLDKESIVREFTSLFNTPFGEYRRRCSAARAQDVRYTEH